MGKLKINNGTPHSNWRPVLRARIMASLPIRHNAYVPCKLGTAGWNNGWKERTFTRVRSKGREVKLTALPYALLLPRLLNVFSGNAKKKEKISL